MLNIINFIGILHSEEDAKAFNLVVHCSMSGFQYPQAKEELEAIGFYLPQDQYDAIDSILNTQVALDIGHRQDERS